MSICIDDSNCPNSRDSTALVGLSAVVTGAAMTPIGWVLFAHYRHPRANGKPLLVPYATSTADKKGGVVGLQGVF